MRRSQGYPAERSDLGGIKPCQFGLTSEDAQQHVVIFVLDPPGRRIHRPISIHTDLGQLDHVLLGKVPQEHWYLDFVGTSNKARGKGLGSLLLEAGLSHGLPVYLESSNPRNLGFYKRHGFQVTGEPVMKAGPPQWTLWRD